MRYYVGTRGSKLALVQTNHVIDRLKEAYPEDEFESVVIKTTGDIQADRQLDKIGSKGIFVKEIEEELADGRIQMAVHSLKDMPEEPEAGLTFAKAWKREDSRDVLVLKNAKTLDELPQGAVIGTGSKRRKYQLLKLRPDLKVVGIRGNIDTRLRKLYEGKPVCEGEAALSVGTEKTVDDIAKDKLEINRLILDGIVIAAAGITRIGRAEEISQYMSVDEIIPAPAQGTLALELRADNTELLAKLNALADEDTDRCVQMERAFLKQIGGDCHTPVAAYCDINDGGLELRAMYGSEDGSQLAFTRVTEADVNTSDCISENEKMIKMVDMAVKKICEELC